MNTLQEQWAKFERAVIPADAPPIQRQEMRRAFFGGARAYQALCMVATTLSDEGAEQVLAGLDEELQAFARSVGTPQEGKQMRANFDNAGWVEAHLKKQLTPFQRRVADIVGIIGSNAYNAPVKWEKVDWEYGGRGVSLVWGNGHLSTFDFMPLTTLVFLCHDARIRLQIEPAGPRGLRLSFWQRRASGSMSQRHPDLDEAIADHRDWIAADHPLLFRNHPEREFEKAAAAMGASNVDGGELLEHSRRVIERGTLEPQVLSGCAVRAEIQKEQHAGGPGAVEAGQEE